MFIMSTLCWDMPKFFKQISGHFLQFELLNVVNCFANILVYSLQVMWTVATDNTSSLDLGI
jgi:hypothetical protein